VNGTTGEGKSLTMEERKTVVEKWISVSNKRSGSIITNIIVNVVRYSKHNHSYYKFKT